MAQVESKSNEIIKRLTNDHSLPMQERNKISEALQHIREMRSNRTQPEIPARCRKDDEQDR